jgi:hypothetical protein
MARRCYAPTGPMSPAGTARWAASASGSRAPSTPSETSSDWNGTAAAPWPASLSGWPSGCWLPGRRDLVELADRRA